MRLAGSACRVACRVGCGPFFRGTLADVARREEGGAESAYLVDPATFGRLAGRSIPGGGESSDSESAGVHRESSEEYARAAW